MSINLEKMLDLIVPILLACALRGIIQINKDLGTAMQAENDLKQRVDKLEICFESHKRPKIP